MKRDASGAFTLIVRAGNVDPTFLPGGPAGVRLVGPWRGDSAVGGGWSGFLSLLAGPGVNGTNDLAVVIQTPTGLISPVRIGDTTPGFANSLFTVFDKFRMNQSGRYIVSAITNITNPAPFRYGLWKGDAQSPGSLERVFVPGDVTPLGPQTQFDYLEGNATLSEDNTTVFRAQYRDGGQQRVGVFRYSATSQEALIRIGDAVSGAPGHTSIANLGPYNQSPDGDVVYSGVSNANQPVLYRREAGSTTPRVVIEPGVPVPGQLLTFNRISALVPNSRGSTLMLGSTLAGNAWWMERDGEFSRILTQGRDSSGVVPEVGAARGLTNLNESDQFAGVFDLAMPIRDGDVLIAYDPDSGPYELLRTGDLFDFGNGLVLPIATIGLTGADVAGNGATLTESGQFVFTVTSVSGDPGPASAIVQFTIPAPGMLSLLGTTLVLSPSGRRRR